MSGDHCTCGQTFRTAEDFRDHMPCPGTERFQETEKWRKRCELAEKALDLMVEAASAGSDFLNESDIIEEALMAWEKSRAQRFVYTDGTEHIIATGRAGLNAWLVEYGYDTEQTDWELVPGETPITILVDKDGMPACEDDDILAENPRTLTAAEWIKLVKEDGLLCSENN